MAALLTQPVRRAVWFDVFHARIKSMEREVPIMKTYMVVHRAPELSWEVVERNWRKLAAVEAASWVTTYYNVDAGVRYCVWRAPDQETLKKIFGGLEITFEAITDVEETKPDMWGEKWEEHLEADALADTLGI
jgi:hypothetical protein